MMSSILVALDDSIRAPGVAMAAAELGRRFSARLLPVHVIAPIADYATPTEGPTVDDVRARALAVAEEQVRALLSDERGVEVRAPLVVVGAAARSIIEVAAASAVDTIVLGSHGYSGWDRVLGTTAAYVVNHAPCNVFVVRARRDLP